MSKKYRSDAMAAIHETMEALHDVGAIDKQTMRVSMMPALLRSGRWRTPPSRALSFLQNLDHGRGGNDSGGFVLVQREEFLIAGHKEFGLACFSQRKQITIFGIRRDGADGQVSAKNREVPKTRGEQLGRTSAKSRPEKRPAGDSTELRYERVTGDQREPLALPGVEKLGGRSKGRQKLRARCWYRG